MATGKHSIPSNSSKPAQPAEGVPNPSDTAARLEVLSADDVKPELPEDAKEARKAAKRQRKEQKKRKKGSGRNYAGTSSASAKKRKRTGVAAPLIVVVIIAALVAVGAFVVAPRFLEEPATIAEGEEVTFTIDEGAGAGQIGETLKESGLISSSSEFLKAVSADGKDSQLKPGTYRIVGGTSMDDIIDIITSGKTGNTLVVPEGYTIKQIAALVNKACGISVNEFETIANTAKDFEVEYEFLKDAYQGSMEGFLFPSTYDVPYDATASDVIHLMLDAYATNIASVDMAYAKKKNMTSYDVLTMASIVEKESRSDEDKKKIASVFYNRLHEGIALGSDVTTYYAVGKDLTEELTTEDLESDSPYNTRNPYNTKLPPSPICNPGLVAIEAAAHPADTDYLYFFYSSKKDKVMFYKTLEEFNKAWAKYQ